MRSRVVVRLALILAVSLLGLGIVSSAAAATVTGTLKLDPPTTQVENGATFSIKVISNTSVPISGLSTSITFNKAVVQVTTITRSPAWASAPVYLAGDAKAIATANSKGNLQNVAAAFFPPTSVPAGNQEFITVGFKAVGCGTATLGVPTGRVDSTMLDGRANTYGATIKLTTTGGTVTVCQGAAGSLAPGASPSQQVEGETSAPSDSFDPNASPSPSGSTGGAVVPPPGAGPTASQAPGDAGAVASTSEQSGWLTFALAALAVAAAGLAALIIVLTIAAIAAVVAGSVFLYRVWRRSEAARATAPASAPVPAAVAATEATDTTPGDQPAETPADRPVAPESPTETGIPALSPSPIDRPLPAPSQ